MRFYSPYSLNNGSFQNPFVKYLLGLLSYKCHDSCITGQNLSGLAGSPAYVAPEVLSGNYSEKVDIWSAGVLLHALLLGFLPFQGDTVEDVFEAIKSAELDFHSGPWRSMSLPARDLIGKMLSRDVSARIAADEVLSKLFLMHQLVSVTYCMSALGIMQTCRLLGPPERLEWPKNPIQYKMESAALMFTQES